jgi:hypothetical protein
MPTEDEQGIDRRQLLKRAAAVGAVAWTVPAIQTINMTHALASVGSPGDICYTIKFEADGKCESAGGNLEKSFSCLWDFDPDIIVTDTDGGCMKATLQIMANGEWHVTLAAGCYLVAGFTKATSDACQPAYTLGGQVAPEGTTGTIVFKPIGQHAVSHVELTFCCNP